MMTTKSDVNLPTEGSAVQEENAAADLDATAKAQELMNLISDLEVLRSYRKARHAGERRQVTKEEKKKSQGVKMIDG